MPFETRLYRDLYRRNPARAMQEITEAIEARAYRPQDFRIRELFEAFVEGGREIVDSWNPRHGGGQSGVMLTEAAVDTATFSNITGQIMYSVLMDAFDDPALIGDQLVTTVPTQFNGEKIPGIGRIGDEAEEIEENDEYPLVGLNEDWIETPETVKRGFIVPVTKEALFFDRTGVLVQHASEVSTWLAVNKEKRILDLVLGVTNSYKWKGTNYDTYQASTPWINVKGSNALADWTDIEAAELLFDALTDPNTGEPIMVMPNTIIVPSALKHTARRFLSATEVRHGSDPVVISGNPITAGQYAVLTNQYVKARTGSASTWFIGEPKRAFAYMENWPATTAQAPLNSEVEFTRDIALRYKISERGTPAVKEPRRMVKCTQ